MNNLFSIGKGLLKSDKDSHGNGSHGASLNPLSMFKQLDRTGDGKIMEDDFVLAIESLGLGGVGEQAVRQVFRQIDKNRNGQLDMSEALAAYEQIKNLIAKSQGGHA